MAEKTPVLDANQRLSLPRGVRLRRDEIRGRTVLLSPERTMALEDTAIAIVARIDGKRTLAEIIDGLAADYKAPRDVIAVDVEAFLQQLLQRRMLEVDS